MDQTILKKGGHEGSYVHPPLKKDGPPLKKDGPPFFKGGWMGGKGGPPLKGGCSSIKYTLAKHESCMTFSVYGTTPRAINI